MCCLIFPFLHKTHGFLPIQFHSRILLCQQAGLVGLVDYPDDEDEEEEDEEEEQSPRKRPRLGS